jgi:hypothetical protein
MDIADSAVTLFGAGIVIGGLCTRGPYYNEAEMPMSKEEHEDKRPATPLERLSYITFGVVLFFFGMYRLRHPN